MLLVTIWVSMIMMKTIGVFNNEETKYHMTSDDTDKFQNDKRLITRKSSEDHVTKIIDEKTRRRP